MTRTAQNALFTQTTAALTAGTLRSLDVLQHATAYRLTYGNDGVADVLNAAVSAWHAAMVAKQAAVYARNVGR